MKRPYAVIERYFHTGQVLVTTLQRVHLAKVVAYLNYVLLQLQTIHRRTRESDRSRDWTTSTSEKRFRRNGTTKNQGKSAKNDRSLIVTGYSHKVFINRRGMIICGYQFVWNFPEYRYTSIITGGDARMISFFTIPKPFRGEISTLQRNAIQSWLKLDPQIEVILYGDDEGIEETASEFGIKLISNVKKNQFGTPTLDYIFKQTKKIAKFDVLCYINTDIILLSDFISAVRQIKRENNFLAIGERWNITVDKTIDFNNNAWESELKEDVIADRCSEGLMGIDFFLFPKDSPIQMLPLAVGRKGWDNWLIYHARTLGIHIIDISPSVKVIHQNHGYNHVPQKRGDKWEGPESDYNLKLIGGGASRMYCWNISDARWMLKDNTIKEKPLSILEMYRKLILIIPTGLHPLIEHLYWIRHRIRYGILE